MTTVQIVGLEVSDALEILYALRKTDYVQDVDYTFTYHRPEYDTFNVYHTNASQAMHVVGAQKSPSRICFEFADEVVATWFILRFGGNIVSDEDTIEL